MYEPEERSKPSPTWVDWLFVEAVRPSMPPESYDSSRSGWGPTAAGGVSSGYDQVNDPDEPPASQVEDEDNGVAE